MDTKEQSCSAEHYLSIACRNLSAVRQAISEYGDASLSSYVQKLFSKIETGYQKRDDLLEVVQQYAGSLLGQSVGPRIANDLAEYPVVLTANHHGADYFSQSIQGSLAFSFNILSRASSATTIPIFSCGNIPLKNPTYPRGLLFYNTSPAEIGDMPLKLPIFPKRFKTQIVSVVSAFDQTMVQKAEQRLCKMVREKQISPTLAEPLHEVLKKDYCASLVTELPNYSQQSVILNSRIWKRLFSEPDTVPDMVYLEQEKIAEILLEYDLSDPESLAWHVMFDPPVRKQVLAELDGVRGCWKNMKLARRLHMKVQDEKLKQALKALEECGTVFFWGIDQKGRKVPLCIEPDAFNNEKLCGTDERGGVWEMPYTPQAITEGLRDGRLLPSSFTCFLVLSFARGLVCVGAYFQAEYLPLMQQGVVTALQKSGYNHIAHFVAKIPTNSYLSGILAVMSRTEQGYLVPAGPAEIIAGGGINSDDIEQMLSLTVREAHIAGLFETIPVVAPMSELNLTNWKEKLAADCSQLLEGKVVVKPDK